MLRAMKWTASLALLIAAAMPAQAGLIFTFTESGGNVLMSPSGTIDTANLVPLPHNGWGGTGIGNFTSGNTVAMIGGTDIGGTDTAFGFHSGTDFSAWAGGVPFSLNTFGWTPSGTTGFATYVVNGGAYEPGLILLGSQMVGSTWTPDQTWSISGSFASLQMNPGTYTVADSQTGEFITYQIGQAASVPEPGTMTLVGMGAFGLVAGAIRRRRQTKTAV